jgi:hypothetical protein
MARMISGPMKEIPWRLLFINSSGIIASSLRSQELGVRSQEVQ